MIADGIVSWRSPQHIIFAQSLKETESTAYAKSFREAFWSDKFASMLEKVSGREQGSEILDVSISENNQKCIKDARSTIDSQLFKRIDLKYRFLVDHA